MEPLSREKQRLAETAIGRAEGISKRYERLFPEHAHDFKSTALWGVMRAASEYDEGKGNTWERWSELCVRGEIANFLRSSKRRKARETPDPYLDERPADEGEEQWSEIDKLLSVLPPKHRKLMRLVYVDGVTPYRAGVALGTTGSNGCKLHRASLAMLKGMVA